MTYFQRTVYVGGYFTAGLLIINQLFAGLGTVGNIILSLIMGILFTGACLWAGRGRLHRKY
ncbi:MAG TPA: hypothetical protein VF171_05090 [Trueperaceae bacterium]